MVTKKKNAVMGLLEGLAKTESIQEVDDIRKTDEITKTDIKKTTRGRKKKSNEVSLEFKGKKLKITNLNKEIIKCNKTFYLEKKYINILEELSKKTGLTTSELTQLAIQLLSNNVELEGFDD
ncbi:MAG: hypothetical protein ACRC57_08240 [Sarcina sp.]